MCAVVSSQALLSYFSSVFHHANLSLQQLPQLDQLQLAVQGQLEGSEDVHRRFAQLIDAMGNLLPFMTDPLTFSKNVFTCALSSPFSLDTTTTRLVSTYKDHLANAQLVWERFILDSYKQDAPDDLEENLFLGCPDTKDLLWLQRHTYEPFDFMICSRSTTRYLR